MGATRRAGAATVLLAVWLAGASASSGAQSLSLDVTFSSSATIAVTLPDGTPVGTSSGTPTQIPAGYYTLDISGPMGLPQGLPYFQLAGPRVDVLSNLNEGGLESQTVGVTLLPSSTYTWTDDAQPGVVYSFTTSAQVLGAAPAAPTSPKSGPPAASQDPVGSGIVALSGKLDCTVSAGGKIQVALGGKAVSRLTPGRYRFTVTDRSTKTGFVLVRPGQAPKTLTSARFTGERSVTVDLLAGRWTVRAGTGDKPAATILVG